MFAALGAALGWMSIPVGPMRVFPAQHAINVLSGVLIGPYWGALAALVTAAIRFTTGTGSIFAFPGSPFGAVAVGIAYRLWRGPWAGLAEPVGTVGVGAVLSALVFAPLVGRDLGFVLFTASFAASSLPGALLGIAVLAVIRRIESFRSSRAREEAR